MAVNTSVLTMRDLTSVSAMMALLWGVMTDPALSTVEEAFLQTVGHSNPLVGHRHTPSSTSAVFGH